MISASAKQPPSGALQKEASYSGSIAYPGQPALHVGDRALTWCSAGLQRPDQRSTVPAAESFARAV